MLTGPTVAAGETVYVGASIGVSIVSPDCAVSPRDAIREADAAMYRAKSRGRSRFEFADLGSLPEASDRLRLAQEIRQAAELSEWRLAFQPFIRLDDRSLYGAEALLRSGPQIAGDAAKTAYGELKIQQALNVGFFVGETIVAGDEVVGTVCAIAREVDAYDEVQLDLLGLAGAMLGEKLAAASRSGEDVHRHMRRS